MAFHSTDKSPLVSPLLGSINNDGSVSKLDGYHYAPRAYAHAYTGVYSFLLSPFKNKKIKFGEIGVHENHSIRGWRDWFPNAEIHGFDWVRPFIDSAKSETLSNVYYHYINVYDKSSIINALDESGDGFDIVIEDSCHILQTQINVIETIHPYINPGGILIIEDVYPIVKNKDNRGFGDYSEEEFAEAIEPFRKHYSNIIFVDAKHDYKYTGLNGNLRMLVLYK
jgi:hypothetical protein